MTVVHSQPYISRGFKQNHPVLFHFISRDTIGGTQSGEREQQQSRTHFRWLVYMHFCWNFRFSSVTEEYHAGSLRDGSIEDDNAYLGDYESRDGYEDSSSNFDFQPKVRYAFTFYIFLLDIAPAGSISPRFRAAFLSDLSN